MANIGFIGIGHMGLPMAMNLLRQGMQVSVYDLNTEHMLLAHQAGAILCENPLSLIKGQDYVITMLPSGKEVSALYLGEKGLFSQADSQTIFIDCSTIDIHTSRLFHAEATAKDLIAFDAPVSGGTAGATAGTLTFMVGGDAEKFTLIEPILSLMGKNIFYAGNQTAGQAAKICNNLMLAAHMIGTAEGFFLAKALGLDLKNFHTIANHSSGQSWSLTHYCPAEGVLENVPAAHGYQAGFASQMMLKDLKLAEEAVNSLHYHFPHLEELVRLYQQFCDAGSAELDFSAIIRAVAKP
jgi:3-hydroxyisobutyrate dehydrogenase